MVDTKDLTKIREYDRYILFQNKHTGIRECFLKVDLDLIKNEKMKYKNKWERDEEDC